MPPFAFTQHSVGDFLQRQVLELGGRALFPGPVQAGRLSAPPAPRRKPLKGWRKGRGRELGRQYQDTDPREF